ncbi:helix-turn-helix transcriptional regulator [Herbiconiux sp. CPCC 205716]|uniref:Helix-turn-helix transcriptional regulator n=1 Tax=Herbiconiux gentiana TaxID=2970912 RepID=A0ABT2GHE7_9MICO|nr:helix-turn-helix transcriptional regulator [Herbiconiux gentiana]MCS5715646.1 helix-turn-helix transcriptional regulator [Herbiconiux gentiana]
MATDSSPPLPSDDLDELGRIAAAELRSGTEPRFIGQLRRAAAALGEGAAREHADALLALAEVESARSELARARSGFQRVLGIDGIRPAVRVMALSGLVMVNVREGTWSRAARLGEEAVVLAELHDLDELRSTAIAASAIVPASRGELPLALQRLERAELPPTRDAGRNDAQPLRAAALVRARICLAIGLNDWNALQRTLDGAALGGPSADHPHHFRRSEWLGLQVLASWHLKKRERADHLITGWSRGADVASDPYFFAFSSVLHDRDGRSGDALDSIHHALELVGPGEDPLGRAWIRLVAGTALTRHGGDDGKVEGLAVYKEARSELAALGASIFVARCDSIIAGAAADVTDSLSSRPLSALSEQQRRVATLVARGFTSAEISARVGVSRKTVDFHVANVLARLGLSSRRDIRHLLRQSGGEGVEI